jgi:hypothetical protein
VGVAEAVNLLNQCSQEEKEREEREEIACVNRVVEEKKPPNTRGWDFLTTGRICSACKNSRRKTSSGGGKSKHRRTSVAKLVGAGRAGGHWNISALRSTPTSFEEGVSAMR